MIITRCPLRVSLVGGSTDTPSFVSTYLRGAVVSFPINLYTYIMLNENGKHALDKYKISYSIVEETDNPDAIHNDIAREVIRHFNLPPVEIVFNSDIPSTGSGLATSSSYLIALIKAVDVYLKLNMSQYEICELASVIERRFNPEAGYQDVFGCGIGGLKRIDFVRSRKTKSGCRPQFVYLDTSLLDSFELFLVPTEIQRNSEDILKSLDEEECLKLLKYVEKLERSIQDCDPVEFHSNILNNWEQKKETSSLIVNNKKIMDMDEAFRAAASIQSWKLLGAGGGGHFLIVMDKDTELENGIRIGIDSEGVKVI